MSIREQHAAHGEPVDIRSQSLRMPIHTADPVIQIVDSDEQNIGLVCGEGSSGGGKNRDCHESQEKSMCDHRSLWLMTRRDRDFGTSMSSLF